jgi:hypothetical protein
MTAHPERYFTPFHHRFAAEEDPKKRRPVAKTVLRKPVVNHLAAS